MRDNDELMKAAARCADARAAYEKARAAADGPMAEAHRIREAGTMAMERQRDASQAVLDLKPVLVFGRATPAIDAAWRDAIAESNAADAESARLLKALEEANAACEPFLRAERDAFWKLLEAQRRYSDIAYPKEI